MIRKATTDDIPQLVEVIREFQSHSFWDCVEFEPGTVADLCERVIQDDDGLLLTTDKVSSFSMFVIVRLPFAERVKVAYEVGLWGKGETLGFLRQTEDWARQRGAFFMKTDEHFGMKSPAKLYERRGFKPFELIYGKVL